MIPRNTYIAKSARRLIPDDDLRLDYLDYTPHSSLESLCSKFDIHSIRKLVFPEMVYDRKYHLPSRMLQLGSPEDVFPSYREHFHKALAFCDRLYDSDKCYITLQFQGGEILRRVMQIASDHYDCQSIRASFSPVPNSVLLKEGESKSIDNDVQLSEGEIDNETHQRAERLVESVVGDDTLVQQNRTRDESTLENALRKARRIRQYGFDSGPIIFEWIRRNGVKPLLANMFRCLYMDKDSSYEFIESNNYVFYPIQYYRESRVTMRAPAFFDQVWLVEYLSRSLPPGYELVVKDHPQQLGALPLSNIRTLRRYATPIAPDIPAREVVQRADAVITLNNTVGYEALMHGKPVVTLGDAFYGGTEYTHSVSNLSEMDQTVDDAIHSNGLERSEVLDLACRIIESSYAGDWGNSNQENVSVYLDSVEDFLTQTI
jgi:hypothetical protein